MESWGSLFRGYTRQSAKLGQPPVLDPLDEFIVFRHACPFRGRERLATVSIPLPPPRSRLPTFENNKRRYNDAVANQADKGPPLPAYAGSGVLFRAFHEVQQSKETPGVVETT
jgi:hypothetical protein